MRGRLVTSGGLALALLSFAGFLLLELRTVRTESGPSGETVSRPEPLPLPALEAAPASREAVTTRGGEEEIGSASSSEGSAAAGDPEEQPDRRPAPETDLEEIKRWIYEREIDSLERLHLLDELVRTGDADTREFWAGDWSGVDDWKRSSNGFNLEKAGDGTLIFIPDEETSRIYTFFENVEIYAYDDRYGAFVSEIDYYGKTILNAVKFLDDDVLAMMTISGRKVDLQLYQRDAERR